MKKLLITLTILITTIFSCFSKQPIQKNTSKNKTDSKLILTEDDEELKKIDLIISMMSERAQKEIVITDKSAFLKDLNFVLAEEKKYNQEDLPLYTLIDKKNKIPSTYIPKNLKKLVKNDAYNINRNDLSLRPDAEKSLREMALAAKKEGITLLVSSTYRSYEYQKNLFARWASIDGEEEAERYSARPGTSQHQAGTAIDFGSITSEFINTKQGKWLYNNASKYGWSLSFPAGYEDITGYMHECWHYRFLGIPACNFQKKYFNNIQQFMLEFIDLWKKN